MGLFITAWFEGEDKKGNWFLANPRFVDYDNPEKVNPPEPLDLGMYKNYLLYAALGDIRNYYSIPYIQKSRGIPEDATKFVKEKVKNISDSVGMGYVTAKELEIYYTTYIDSEDEIVQAAANFVKKLYFDLLHIAFGVCNERGSYLNVNNTRLIFWFE